MENLIDSVICVVVCVFSWVHLNNWSLDMVCDPYFRAVIKISSWRVNDTSQARNQSARDFVLFYLSSIFLQK